MTVCLIFIFLVQFSIQDIKHTCFQFKLCLFSFSNADNNVLICIGIKLCFCFAVFPANIYGDIPSGFLVWTTPMS